MILDLWARVNWIWINTSHSISKSRGLDGKKPTMSWISSKIFIRFPKEVSCTSFLFSILHFYHFLRHFFVLHHRRASFLSRNLSSKKIIISCWSFFIFTIPSHLSSLFVPPQFQTLMDFQKISNAPCYGATILDMQNLLQFVDSLHPQPLSFGALFLNPPSTWPPKRHDITHDISISTKVQWFRVPTFTLSGPFNKTIQIMQYSMEETNKIIQGKKGLITDVATAHPTQGLDGLENWVFSEYISARSIEPDPRILTPNFDSPFHWRSLQRIGVRRTLML